MAWTFVIWLGMEFSFYKEINEPSGLKKCVHLFG
jgi:hypothetical protein